MKWEISNNKTKTKLAVIVALVAFSTVFMLTGALLTAAYGYEFYDPTTKYENPIDQGAAKMTAYCLEEKTDNKIVLNDKGLEGVAIAEITGLNFCNALIEGLLDSGEGWYVASVHLDEDGQHTETVMRR